MSFPTRGNTGGWGKPMYTQPGGHTFQMIAGDNGTSDKSADTFETSIDGVPYASGVLGGGNISRGKAGPNEGSRWEPVA